MSNAAGEIQKTQSFILNKIKDFDKVPHDLLMGKLEDWTGLLDSLVARELVKGSHLKSGGQRCFIRLEAGVLWGATGLIFRSGAFQYLYK